MKGRAVDLCYGEKVGEGRASSLNDVFQRYD